MNQIIFIKYDELSLKGNNINFFKQKLINNITEALIHLETKINVKYDYIIIEPNKNTDIELVIAILKRIPGINSISLAHKVSREFDQVAKTCIDIAKKFKTFKIEVKRSDKSFEYNSDIYKRMIAGEILKQNNNIKVDIHNPELKINIEIKKEYMIIYSKKITGAKGLPIGTSGRALVLLSGGIDSPVASDILMRRGMHVDFITFITPPHTSEQALEKVKQLVKLLTLNYRLEKPKLYICNFTSIQTELTHLDLESYRINLLRRSFMRIATEVANKYGYDCLATGESLGQVASQTIESLVSIQDATNKLILRPLIGFNKEQIIEHAKNIGTYNESIKPFEDSCILFAPKNPITKPKLEISKELETKLYLLKELEYNVIEKIEIIEYGKAKK